MTIFIEAVNLAFRLLVNLVACLMGLAMVGASVRAVWRLFH